VAFDEGDAQIPHQHGPDDLSGRPSVARLRPLVSQDRSEEEFEISLESLLDRLEMTVAQ
jgi:TetR/AcrR family tetracycline transcriptional repressor